MTGKQGQSRSHFVVELVNVGGGAGYDLRVEVSGQIWYPQTRTHGYGSGSIPLASGFHPIKVTYVDIRRGGRETSHISGEF